MHIVKKLLSVDELIEHMKNNDCPTLDMIDSIYLNGEQFYEWKMREWSCWSYEETRLTKEEKLSEFKIELTVLSNSLICSLHFDNLDL